MNCVTTAPTSFRKPSPIRHRVSLFVTRGIWGILLGFVFTLLAVSSPAQNRVLELDGNGSYVELPPNIFQNLTEATIEAWAKWDRFNNYSRIFEFGAPWQSMSVFNHDRNNDLRFNLYPRRARENPALAYNARANGILRSNEWTHIAVVAGPGGMKLYVNGVVVATHTNEACLSDIKVEQKNLLGRGLAGNAWDLDFCGQIDEVRVWNYRRSAEQIRENMNRRLTGREAGLVGLWNFDDGLATDATFRGNHGKLVGNARAVTPDMPAGMQLIAGELPVTPAATVQPTPPPMPVEIATAHPPVLYWWIAGALTLIAALLVWLALMLKRGGSAVTATALVARPSLEMPEEKGIAAVDAPDVKERALAELTEFAKQSLVQGLYSQRNALLEVQQKAHRELAELEARLAALRISDRILAYEKRIAELERELENRTGELREVANTTLELLRRKVAEEREIERAARRFN